MIDAAMILGLPVGLAARRELQPLRYAVLERDGQLGALSDAERRFGHAAYVNTLARSVRLREVAEEIFAVASDEGAELLPLKGVLFAFALYPDPGMRPMGDLDLAVREHDVERLAARLGARGFKRVGQGQRRFGLAATHHVILDRPGTPRVELHVRLVHELGADGALAPFFARALEVPWARRSLRAPSWDDHFAYVALHAATHAFADSPLWLFDLAALAPRASQSRIEAEAVARRAVSAVHFGLAIARRYFADFPHAIRPPKGHRVRARLLRSLLGDDPLATAPGFVASQLTRLALTDRPSDMARSIGAKFALRFMERVAETR